MSSGGKSGAQNQSKNIYGTLAGAICWGPLDWLTAVIHNGNYLWQGSLTLTDDATDLTGSIADPTYIAPGGYLKIYRGTETQDGDAAIPNSPRDKGTAKLVAKHLFFGQDTGTAPNLQIIGGRLPRVPTSIVAADDNVADDGQINPIAAWAEIILDERGGGYDEALFDGPSWQAAAHWAYENRDFTFCSPLITEQSALRDIAKQLLDPFNGFCRRNNAGKLVCNVYEWGNDPGGLNVLDARHWTKRPKFPLGDWSEVPTEMLVNFIDRAFEYQENTVIVSNARAFQIRQVDDQRRIDRKHVTRIPQAHRHATEYIRRISTAPTRATITIRAPFLAALDLNVGSKIKVDTDPEPGGAGLAQLCRIERIEQDATDQATLEVMTDNLVPATAYTPTWTDDDPVDEVSPPLEHFQAIPLPPNAFGWPPSIGLLATRPDPAILGFQLYFSDSSGGSYADLGQQAGFAARARLDGAIADSDTTLDLEELDGLSGNDASLAANTPGGNETEAQDNVLLAVLMELDGDGRVELGADGDPLMEFVSIVDRAIVSGATHTYTVLRGRLGTTARAWSDNAVAWIIPRANLTPWRHTLLSSMLGGVAYFRLVSFTDRAYDESTPVPECSVNMLPATAPSYGGNIDGTTGPDDGVAPNPVSGVTVTAGLSMLVLEWTNPTNTPLKRIFVYESSTTSRPINPQFAFDPGQHFFFRTGLPASATRYYWIEVQAVNGKRALAGYFNGTTRSGVDLSDIVPGMTMVEIVGTLPASGNFDGRTVFLTTDKKLYRYDSAAGAWTTKIDGYDLVADSILAGALSAGAVTAYAVGANEIITNTANIADAIITSAKIYSLVAEKIEAGILNAMIVKAGKFYVDSVCANEDYPSNTMPIVGFQQAEDGTHYTGMLSSPLELPLVTFVGWGVGSGYSEGRFGKSTMRFLCAENGGCSPNVSPVSYVDLKISYRINGGSWSDVTPFSTRALPGNGTLNSNGGVIISGLSETDEIEFGVRVNSDHNSSQLNVVNLSVSAFNL